MKFIIYLEGNPSVQGYTRFEYKWSQQHGVYLWQGREIDEKEFNKEAEIALTRYSRLHWHPKVKILPGPPAEPVEKEISVADAEAVMERLAPHRLKKKTGPKPEFAEI